MTNHYDVPYYSQLRDVSAVEWRMEACGIAAMAMEIGFYKPNAVSVDKMLDQAIASGSYAKNAGWKHHELSALATRYGLAGKVYNLATLKNEAAFANFKVVLSEGPVIVSIHNKFNPKATLGHLIVVTGIDNDFIYYSDPASTTETKGEKKITIQGFLAGWKKRFITVRDPQSKIAKTIDTNLSMIGISDQGPLLPIGSNI